MDRPRVQMAFPRADKLTIGWMITLVVVWIVSTIAYRSAEPSGPELFGWVALSSPGLLDGRLWTLVTHAFVHHPSQPVGHLLLNCLMLYFFAPQMRARWGTARFLTFCAATLGVSAVVVLIAGMVGWPGFVIGVDAISLGLIVAWGLTFPERTIHLMFVFPVKAMMMVYLSVFIVALEFIAADTPPLLHLAGVLTALLLVFGIWRGNHMRLWWDNLLVFLRLRKKAKLTLVPPIAPKPGSGGRDTKGPGGWVH